MNPITDGRSPEELGPARSGLLTVDVLTAAYLAATAIIALLSGTETGLWLALLHLLGIGGVLVLGRLLGPLVHSLASCASRIRWRSRLCSTWSWLP